MFGAIGPSFQVYHYPDYASGEADLLSMSLAPDQYPLAIWKEVLSKKNPNVSDDIGMTPLMNVINRGSTEGVSLHTLAPILEVLIAHGADCNQANEAGNTALELLCQKQWDDFPQLREGALEQIRSHGIELASLRVGDEPLLLYMSICPDQYSLAAWETLLLNGVNPNVSDDVGMTPLMTVINWGRTEGVSLHTLAPILEVLIAHGADCNQANAAGNKALDMLLQKQWDDFPQLRESALEQIRRHGIELASLGVGDEPLLLYMSTFPGQYSSVAWEALLLKGVNPNVSDDVGMTPLMNIIISDRTRDVSLQTLAPIIEVLIANGADCNQASAAGNTALGMLCQKKWDDFPQLREWALEQTANNGIKPESLMANGKPLLLSMSRCKSQYTKLGLRSVLRYGVLPDLKENESEGTVKKKPKLSCDFDDTLEQHNTHFCYRPLEYRCICAVDRYSRGQVLSVLPKRMNEEIQSLFHS